MQKTISWVNPQTNEWNGPSGVLHFIEGSFSDGGAWSVGCKPESTGKRMQELQMLVGKPGEYELETKTDNRGKTKFKLKSWPGKPVFGGAPAGQPTSNGGGSRPYVETFAQSKECKSGEQRSIQRAVALKEAVAHCAPKNLKVADVLLAANAFFAWLSEPVPVEDPQPENTPPASNQPPPSDDPYPF